MTENDEKEAENGSELFQKKNSVGIDMSRIRAYQAEKTRKYQAEADAARLKNMQYAGLTEAEITEKKAEEKAIREHNISAYRERQAYKTRRRDAEELLKDKVKALRSKCEKAVSRLTTKFNKEYPKL